MNLRQTLLYSAASAGLNLIGVTVSTWLLYFYLPPASTGRVAFVSADMIGVLLTLGRLWDGLIDPVIGYWSDNTQQPGGRRKPFLMWAAPGAVLTLVLLWTPPAVGMSAVNGVYFFGVTVLFYSCLSLVGIPYDSSLPEVATSPQERVRLSMWKNIFGTLGVLAGVLVSAPLFKNFGPLVMGLVVGGLGGGCILLTVLNWPTTATCEPVEPLDFRTSIRVTFTNVSFLRLFVASVLLNVVYGILLAVLPYFVTLVVGQPEKNVGLFQGVVIVMMLVSAPVWNLLAKRYALRDLLRFTLLGLMVMCALMFSANSVVSALLVLGGLGPFLGGYFILVFAVMGTVVDGDEKITGQRREAMFYGTFSLAHGLGPALAALILPWLFAHFGYSAAESLGVRLAFPVASLLAGCAWLSLVGQKD